MRIAIASGKGGTGKTTISSNLAYYLSSQGQATTLVDCDVEEPNNHIFFNPAWYGSEMVQMPVPEVEAEKCTGCGKCAEICEFNALVCLKGNVLIFPELCHGCKGCIMVCPTSALKETTREIGEVQLGIKDRLNIVQGVLRIGEAMSPPLIRKVKEHGDNNGTVIIDCPPGTSCPMIQAVRGSDFVLLVTEPTPFGLNDLKLAVETIRELNLPFAVCINRSTIGDNKVHDYCKQEKIPIILEIPEDREIAQAYSQGRLFLKTLPHYQIQFDTLLKNIKELVVC
ncbi:MAG: (4Fe-4S)-binding protein [Peptococcaceae bacterium BICA1-8]|nr:MAG: (4Fe-4S)-binding protein [Peptococcaceae bacterium BICA1-8]